jgi:transcriptional regulator with XRE-family HTH domain
MSLGQFLCDERVKSHMTLREAAERAGISNPYLSMLEHDKIKEPSVFVLSKISKTYCVSFVLLLLLAGYQEELRIIRKEWEHHL